MLITLARKPLTGSVAANCLNHGCGALNVDATRIGYAANEPDSGANFYRNRGMAMPENRTNYFRGPDGTVKSTPSQLGRWPANVLLCGKGVLAGFPQSSVTGSRSTSSREAVVKGTTWNVTNHLSIEYTDSGSAARYFKKVEDTQC